MSISRTLALFMWVIASIFYAYQYILRVMPSIMIDDIMRQFNIDAALYGQFTGIYYIGYALMHLPLGIMLDRYGPKKVMTVCILLTVIGMLPIVYSTNWLCLVIGRALLGVGSSAAILGTFKIIRMTFAEKRFTQMLSLSVTIGLIGAIYGGAPVSYMVSQLGYHSVVQIFSGIGLLLALITYLIIPKTDAIESKAVIADIKTVFANPKVIFLCISAGLMVGPLEGFADVWGSEFLKEVYNLENNLANTLPSMIFLGMCFGAPFLSFLAERTGYYSGVIIGAGLFMTITFVSLLSGLLTPNTITISFIITGISCAYQILALYKASTYVSENVSGLTTAVANMIIMIFGYAFHSTIGYLIDINGGTDSPSAFIYGLSIIPLTLGLGTLGFVALAYHDWKRSNIFKAINAE